ncbi:hypothetical protein HKBW3S03_01367 [Candidatus Hakubella thermalkaliphila]|uniref:Uncharacterized protein n=1 Tax=Candidatus Hakubella thermalkaliphila TaxID=2754717 RepID=A0A6V8NI35_9ACTN|nr:hypothetical protein HKBW3S03_01367 [Candidatus Hakubella thermalkaliphila]
MNLEEVELVGKVEAIIDIPEELYLSLSALGLTKEKIASESRKLLALKCFKEKILSLGKAAELSGLSKWDFIEYLSAGGVSVVDYNEDEIKRELESVDRVAERLKK